MKTDISSRDAADLLLYNLKRSKELRHQHVNDPNLSLDRHTLSQWQSERLAHTHEDLRTHPRYKLATEFFLTDLYGPKDFSRRDKDLERSYPMIIAMLPPTAVYTIALAVELDALSQELDISVLRVLANDLGISKTITEEAYAEAYRRCNNYDDRKHQIKLIRTIGEDLEGVVSKPFIYAALCLARTPAHLAGFGELQDFLERGFRAFRYMKGSQEFLDTISGRELQILDRIYANHSQPFNLEIPD